MKFEFLVRSIIFLNIAGSTVFNLMTTHLDVIIDTVRGCLTIRFVLGSFG